MKKIVTLAVKAAILFISTPSYSQCTAFTQGGGGIYNEDFGSGVVADASGNIYFCGPFEDTAYFGSTMLTSDSITGKGFFFNKYDAQGNQLWSQSLGNISSPYGLKTIALSGNNIYITCSASYFQQGADTVNFRQVILWKLDFNGNLIWRNNYYSSSVVFESSIIADGLGGVYLTGRFSDTLMFSPVMLHAPNLKTWMTHIHAGGTTDWAKQAAGTASPFTNRGNDLVVLSNGNIALTGYYKDSLRFDGNVQAESLTNAAGNTKYKPYLALFDASGNNQWIKGFTTEGQNIHTFFDCGYGITSDNADNIYITGTLSDSTLIGGLLVNADSGRAFLAKFSSAGIIQWIKLFAGNNGKNWGTTAATDNQDIYIIGNTTGNAIFGSSTDTSSNTQVFVAKADMNGNISTHLRTSAGGYSISYQSYFDNAGSISIAGNFSGTNIAFPFSTTINNTGADSTLDVFIWKLCLNNLVSVNEASENDIAVFAFPNPATSELTVQSGKFKVESIEIYDVLGERVFSQKQEAGIRNQVSINISALSYGIYFIKVRFAPAISGAGKQERVAKFVKQ